MRSATKSNLAMGVALVALAAAALVVVVSRQRASAGNDVPQLLTMVFFPLASLLGGAAFYYAVYQFVVRKGYHGAVTLVVFLGPALWGILKRLGFRSEAFLDGKIASPIENGIILLGLVVLVFLPKRHRREGPDGPEEAGNR